MDPEHLDYKECKLSTIAEIRRGNRITIKDLISDGKYPVISGGINPMGYYKNYNRQKNTITVAKYGTAGYVNWQETDFWANDVCYTVHPYKQVNNRFLYYSLVSLQPVIKSLVIDAVPAHLPIDRLGAILIKIPSLILQEEIVRILDKFTLLKAELEAELEARTAQYEYYRDLLLTFDQFDSQSLTDRQTDRQTDRLGG